MASRHQRRKAAAAKRQAIELKVEIARQSAKVAAIVKSNLSKPIERNYYAGIRSNCNPETLGAYGARFTGAQGERETTRDMDKAFVKR